MPASEWAAAATSTGDRHLRSRRRHPQLLRRRRRPSTIPAPVLSRLYQQQRLRRHIGAASVPVACSPRASSTTTAVASPASPVALLPTSTIYLCHPLLGAHSTYDDSPTLSRGPSSEGLGPNFLSHPPSTTSGTDTLILRPTMRDARPGAPAPPVSFWTADVGRVWG